MSGSTLILGVSAVPLIQNSNLFRPDLIKYSKSTDEAQVKLYNTLYSARWTVSIALSITIACQTAIALLSRSLDRKGCLKVSSRCLRLLPRMLVIVIVMCLPIDQFLSPNLFLGIILALLLLCLNWEWFASLDRGGGWFEPWTSG